MANSVCTNPDCAEVGIPKSGWTDDFQIQCGQCGEIVSSTDQGVS